jgi:hypothetical protein
VADDDLVSYTSSPHSHGIVVSSSFFSFFPILFYSIDLYTIMNHFSHQLKNKINTKLPKDVKKA